MGQARSVSSHAGAREKGRERPADPQRPGSRLVLAGTLTEAQAEALRTEALRIYGRYQREFVEALGLCPWAVRAREEGHVSVDILLVESAGALEPTLEAVDRVAADEAIEVGLLVFPRSAVTRAEHESFVSAVRERHAEAHDGSPPLAMAAFHPDAEADLTHPSRLVPFIRRSPDPAIQLVRRSALEAVRRRTSDRGTAFVDPSSVDFLKMLSAPAPAPLHERVADKNRETIEAMGVEAAEAILRAIGEDREASYARVLSEAQPPQGAAGASS